MLEQYILDNFSYSDGDIIAKRSIGRRKKNEICGTDNGHGYIQISILGKRYMASHIVWFLHHKKLPSKFLDHIDRDTKNNRIENLRECSMDENNRNRRVSLSSTGYRGVCSRGKHFRAIIHIGNGRRLYFTAKTAVEAAKLYDEAAKKYHGEFAILNFP